VLVRNVPSNVPSTTAVPEKCGAGFCTRALGVYAGNDMAKACDPARENDTGFGSPTRKVALQYLRARSWEIG
jgi:hypothetical protein